MEFYDDSYIILIQFYFTAGLVSNLLGRKHSKESFLKMKVGPLTYVF